MEKPTQSPEATSAKQTSPVEQLNPTTCTKPSALQPSYILKFTRQPGGQSDMV